MAQRQLPLQKSTPAWMMSHENQSLEFTVQPAGHSLGWRVSLRAVQWLWGSFRHLGCSLLLSGSFADLLLLGRTTGPRMSLSSLDCLCKFEGRGSLVHLVSLRHFLNLLRCLLPSFKSFPVGTFYLPLEHPESKGASIQDGMFCLRGNCYTILSTLW